MVISQNIALESYYGLAVYKARKIYYGLPQVNRGLIELNDLVQEGLIGLLKAAHKYDPERKTSFSSFSSLYIDGAIKDYLRKQDPLSQKERRAVKTLERARQKIGQQLGKEPSTCELARALNTTEDDVRRIQGLSKNVLYIDDLQQPEKDLYNRFTEELSSFKATDPEKDLTVNELWTDVNICIGTALDTVERSILTVRVLGELTLNKTSELLRIEINKVYRIEKNARNKMKCCLEGKGWHVTDIVEIYP